jgi:Flp pilus assembly protein TadD
MFPRFSSLNRAFRVAAAFATPIAVFAPAPAAGEDGEANPWFLVDRMAVDPLTGRAPAEEAFHKGGMRTLRLQRGEVSMPTLNPPDMNLSPTTASDFRKAEEHAKRANRLLAENEPSKALLEMRDALSYTPGNTDLLKTAARLALDLQKFTMAETFSRQYLTRVSNDPDMMALRATALLRLSRVGDARAIAEQTLAVYPEHLASRMLSLEIQLLREDRNVSPAFWRTRRLEPLAEVTRLLLLHQKTIEAALGLEDFLLYCDTLLGEGTGLLLERIHTLQMKILNPANPGQSEEELETIQALKRTGFTCFGLDAIEAEVFRRLGRKADADRAWAAMLSRYGEVPDAHLNFARYSILEGRPADAESALQKCRQLVGQDSEIVRFLLAAAYSLQGKTGDATELFNDLALHHREMFRSWMEMEPAFEDAVNRMPNAKAILRLLEIPPESE